MDRYTELRMLIDDAFDIDSEFDESFDASQVLTEAKQIRLTSIPGLVRDPSQDFTDDGNRFQGYIYKDTVPVTYLRDHDEIYLNVAFHHLDDINYDEYHRFSSYQEGDTYNGDSVSNFDPENFKRILDNAYKDITEFRGSVQDVTDDDLEPVFDKIKKIISDDKLRIKAVLERNRDKVFDLTDYQFRQIKEYLNTIKQFKNANFDDLSQTRRREMLNWTDKTIQDRYGSDYYINKIEKIFSQLNESFDTKLIYVGDDETGRVYYSEAAALNAVKDRMSKRLSTVIEFG